VGITTPIHNPRVSTTTQPFARNAPFVDYTEMAASLIARHFVSAATAAAAPLKRRNGGANALGASKTLGTRHVTASAAVAFAFSAPRAAAAAAASSGGDLKELVAKKNAENQVTVRPGTCCVAAS